MVFHWSLRRFSKTLYTILAELRDAADCDGVGRSSDFKLFQFLYNRLETLQADQFELASPSFHIS